VNLKILDCSGNNLVSLKLEKNNCLEKIICLENKLTNLSPSDNNSNLTYLDCSRNNLSNTEIFAIIKVSQKLIYLNLRDNFFPASKLDVFTELLQIEELYLGTVDIFRIGFTQTYNQFYGSLKPLAELKI
jgi:Leucine-rich repeat (LRR) protein